MSPMPTKNNDPYQRTERPGSWYVRVDMADGSRKRFKGGNTKRDAILWQETLQNRQRLIAQGLAKPEDFQVADGGLRDARELLDEFCEELKGARRSKGYVREFRTWVGGYIKAARITKVNQSGAASIERYLSGILTAGNATETRNKARTRLHTFFDWVVSRRHLTDNPAKDIKRVRSDGGRDKPRALTVEEADALIVATKNPRRRLAYLLGLRAGLRVEEAHRLRMRHIDMDGGWLGLTKTITKEGRDADLPMHPEIAEAIKALKRPGATLCGPTPSRYTWKRDLIRAGIVRVKDPEANAKNWAESDLIGYRDDRGRVLSRRCLRHTFGTHLAMAGIPIHETAKLMRHTDPSLTLQYYTDARLLDLRGAVGKLGKKDEPETEQKERTA